MSDGTSVLVGYLYLLMFILMAILGYRMKGIEQALVVGIIGCLLPILGAVIANGKKKE